MGDILSLARRDALASGSFVGSAAFLGNCSVLGVFAVASSHVISGAISIGDLSSFLMYTMYVGASVAGLSGLYSDVVKTVGATSRCLDWLDEFTQNERIRGTVISDETNQAFCEGVKSIYISAPIPPSSSSPTLPFKHQIQFKNVSFSYPNRPSQPILSGLNLTIPYKSRIAIVGDSGCGKSTLLSLLLKFYTPSAGQITVDGVDLESIDTNFWRNEMGVVFQEPALFSGTIKENILYGQMSNKQTKHFYSDAQKEFSTAEKQLINSAAYKAGALDFIQSFPSQFDTFVGEGGSALSGGQKQRIAISRALLKQPRILLLDEATSALDAANEQLVQQNTLDDAFNDGSLTVVLISHKLSTIKRADLIAVLKNGAVVEYGTFHELANRGGFFSEMISKIKGNN